MSLCGVLQVPGIFYSAIFYMQSTNKLEARSLYYFSAYASYCLIIIQIALSADKDEVLIMLTLVPYLHYNIKSHNSIYGINAAPFLFDSRNER